jgi:hypothetical protein
MMRSFKEYSSTFSINCDPEKLDFCLQQEDFCLLEESVPVLTPGGNRFVHPSEEVIRLLSTDLQLFNRSPLPKFSSPLLYSFQMDLLNSGEDAFASQWEDLLNDDPFVRIKTSGGSTVQPFGVDDPLFTFAYSSLAGLMETVNIFAGKVMSEIMMEEIDSHPFPVLLKLSYERLSGNQKAAVQALSGVHDAGIVMPLLLVLGYINPLEYAKGLISLRIQIKEHYSETISGVTTVLTYLGVVMAKPLLERELSTLIREGEGDSIEFKSTLRWDIRAGKTNPAMERSCLKTISAFLNSKGGCLLIGVSDDGSILGIQTDKFANEDKFLLHLWTLIRICLGRDFSPYIRTRLEKVEESTVCLVYCQPSNRPVFLCQPGFAEEMYIRVGPSSNALDISEALKYIKNHFPS